ncbi:MAG: energy transducer TonB [Parvularculaceae bacterium]
MKSSSSFRPVIACAFFVAGAFAASGFSLANSGSCETSEKPKYRMCDTTEGAMLADETAPKVDPVKRVAPRILQPPFKDGKCKGEITVRFDVTDDGKTENICVVRTDDEVLVKPTVDAVGKWKMQPKTGDEPENFRRGIETVVTLNFCKA